MLRKLFICSVLFSQVALADKDDEYFFDPVDGQFDLGHHLAENAYGFLPVPILITEPALGYGGGVAGIFLHESEQEKEIRKQKALESIDGGANLVPAAITAVGAIGTENGSWFAFAAHRQSWKKDSIRYVGLGGAGKVNFDLYSDLGGLLPSDNPFSFDTQTEAMLISQKVLFRAADTPLMLGIKQYWSQSSISSSNEAVDWIFQRMLGRDNTTSGLGIVAEYDTRNNIFYPTDGYSISAEYMSYSDKFGSNYNYDSLSVSGENFWPVADKWTLAVAGDYEALYAKDDTLPPTVKPYVDLRGISAFRYQGDQVATLQAQVMYNIDNRWTISGFYGAGLAYNDEVVDLSEQIDNKTSEIVSAYGVGFRYQIARRYGIHLGLDMAFSKEENALYVTMGSGF
ncbi:outer membrane protein assembly factor [Shewanella olleyana]|uniref:BamA/TamA family outer membrane protein n=1 Tax=Shewanella olleyana TaxID=135626 RepID=UPI0020103D26|nr:BamA/TamA family outer membrane protein [Shewanella olleyana]MCL1067355.1 outer membrane protein assembly factor [Shewanella olleyana]